ncbi:hypothetical protein ACKXGF_02765 [Alkalibacillus sp. S2W]|uniref:hypothetical protein n=1 Tax=Alkalibacillus sp. S2W TaxID=3386553 RepID=UPI00398D3DAE
MDIFKDMVVDYHDKLDKRRLAILCDLVKFRALTTNQIRDKYFGGKGNNVNNVLSRLRKSGYIKTGSVKGSREGKKGYPYHTITESGIEILFANGKEFEYEPRKPHFQEFQVRYIVQTNDILLYLEEEGWQSLNSRDVKFKYNLDKRSNILGELTSPDKENYAVYVFERNTDVRTIGRIQSEIVTQASSIPNAIIFTKGKNSFNKFVELGLKKGLHTGGKVKLIPSHLGVPIFSAFPKELDWVRELGKHINFEVVSTEKEGGSAKQSFPYLIRHNGEEKYFVDMSFTDLSQLHKLEAYARSNYRWEKKRVLVSYMLGNSIDLMSKQVSSITDTEQLSYDSFLEMVNGFQFDSDMF